MATANTSLLDLCFGGLQFVLLSSFCSIETLEALKLVSRRWNVYVGEWILWNNEFSARCLQKFVPWEALPSIGHFFTKNVLVFKGEEVVKFSQLFGALVSSRRTSNPQSVFDELVWGINSSLVFATAAPSFLDEPSSAAVGFCLEKLGANASKQCYERSTVSLESLVRAIIALPAPASPGCPTKTAVDSSSDMGGRGSPGSVGGRTGATREGREGGNPLKKRRFAGDAPQEVKQFFLDEFKSPVTNLDLIRVCDNGYDFSAILLAVLKMSKPINRNELYEGKAYYLWRMLEMSGVETSPELLKFLCQAHLIGLMKSHCMVTMQKSVKHVVDTWCIVNKRRCGEIYFTLFCYLVLTSSSRPESGSEQKSRFGQAYGPEDRTQGCELLLSLATGNRGVEASKRRRQKMARDDLVRLWQDLKKPSLVFWVQYYTRKIREILAQNLIPPYTYLKLDAGLEHKCNSNHAQVANGSLFYSMHELVAGKCGCEKFSTLSAVGGDFQHLGQNLRLFWGEPSMESWAVCELAQLERGVGHSLQSNEGVVQAHKFVTDVIKEHKIAYTAGEVASGELVARLSGSLWPKPLLQRKRKLAARPSSKKVSLATIGVQYAMALGALQEPDQAFWVFQGTCSGGADLTMCLTTSLVSFCPQFSKQKIILSPWHAPTAEPFVAKIAHTATYGTSSGPRSQTHQSLHVCCLVLRYFMEKAFEEALTRPGPHVVPLALSSAASRHAPPSALATSSESKIASGISLEEDPFWDFRDRVEGFSKGAGLLGDSLFNCFLVCATQGYTPMVASQDGGLLESFLGKKLLEQEQQCAIDPEQTRLDGKKHGCLVARARRTLASILGDVTGHGGREMEAFFLQYKDFVRIVVQLTKLLAESMIGALHGRVPRTPANMAYVEALMKKIFPQDWMRST